MRAAIAAESADIPSVSIVCEGFAGQASATARGMGYDGLPLAVTVGHVDAQSTEEMIANFTRTTIGDVVAGLTGDDSTAATENTEPAALDIVASGTIDEVNRHFLDRGWSDGNVITPPTQDRVEHYLEGSGHDPWKTVGVSPSAGRDFTIWSIAVNAVMAGCRPEHLPILIAIAEILADPNYGSEHSGNTTGADALIILAGPNTESLGFNSGPGAQREGAHANTSVGRWLRLYLRNVCGFTAAEHDKATFGNPARPVLTEDHTRITSLASEVGWASVAEQLGHDGDGDVVSMARMNSGLLLGSVFGSTPEEITPYLANGLARVAAWDLTHVHGLGTEQFQPLLVISPLLAQTYASAGWGLAEIQAALFDQARIPAHLFERFIGDWTNLTAGRPKLADLAAEGTIPAVFGESNDPDRLVPVAARPEQFLIAVAGDPNRANAYAFSNDGPHGWWTTKTVDHTPASDLVCNIGGAEHP